MIVYEFSSASVKIRNLQSNYSTKVQLTHLICECLIKSGNNF